MPSSMPSSRQRKRAQKGLFLRKSGRMAAVLALLYLSYPTSVVRRVVSLVPPVPQRRSFPSSATLTCNQIHSSAPSPRLMLQSSLYRHRTRVERTAPRLYHSSPLRNKNNGNDTNEEGFLVKAKNALQQLSPTNWFLSDEERRAKAERKRVKAAVKSELQQVLKDAPLPLRMLGGIVGNVLSNLVSNVAQVASSQQDMVDTVYQRAVANIQRDPAVADALGVSGGSNAAGAVVVVGPPYAQSSSSSSINGATTMRIEMSFPVGVGGGGRQGVGRLVASRQGSSNNDENNISFQVLEVQVNGRTIPVSTTLRGNVQSKKFYGPSSNDSDIIEAEIIEKETKTK